MIFRFSSYMLQLTNVTGQGVILERPSNGSQITVGDRHCFELQAGKVAAHYVLLTPDGDRAGAIDVTMALSMTMAIEASIARRRWAVARRA
jgi:hypothetical protein